MRLLKRCIYGEKMKTKQLHVSNGALVPESGVNGTPPPPPPACLQRAGVGVGGRAGNGSITAG